MARFLVLAILAFCLVSLARADGNVVDLTPDNFDQVVDGSKPVFVEFFAPWYSILVTSPPTDIYP